MLAAMVMALTLGACDNGSSSGSGGGDGDGSGSSGGGSKSSYLKIEGNKVTGVHLNKIPSDGKIVIPDGVEEFAGDWTNDLDAFFAHEDVFLLSSDKVTSISLPASLKSTRNVIPDSWIDYSVQDRALDIDIIYRGTLADYCKTEGGYLTLPYAKSIKVGDDDLKTLEALVIPDGVTEIANSAFGYLPNITSVTIPASVKKIGDLAFGSLYSHNIETVTYKGRLKDWCDIIINDYLYVYAQSIKMSDGKDLKTLTKITADDIAGATKISDYAFADCKALTDVVIPESVTEIGKGAFDSCSFLASVTFKITDGWHEGEYDSEEDVSDAENNAYNLRGASGKPHPGLYRKTE